MSDVPLYGLVKAIASRFSPVDEYAKEGLRKLSEHLAAIMRHEAYGDEVKCSIDHHGRPVCPSCGEPTNVASLLPTLVCWSCGILMRAPKKGVTLCKSCSCDYHEPFDPVGEKRECPLCAGIRFARERKIMVDSIVRTYHEQGE